MFGFLRNRKRRALRRSEFVPEVADVVESSTLRASISSLSLRTRMDETVRILMAELSWEGCDGFVVDERMKATIAGHAATMLLGIQDYYFDTVPSILVFPQSFVRDQYGRPSWHAGEAWQFGPLAFSWSDVLRDSRRLDGKNVVIHEFAHHLDGLDGEMGGSIPFSDRSKLKQWHEVSEREYQMLVEAVSGQRPTLFDYYGATNSAEFFAVASECFFELPRQFEQQHPELFGLLCDFYQINPVEW